MMHELRALSERVDRLQALVNSIVDVLAIQTTIIKNQVQDDDDDAVKPAERTNQ